MRWSRHETIGKSVTRSECEQGHSHHHEDAIEHSVFKHTISLVERVSEHHETDAYYLEVRYIFLLFHIASSSRNYEMGIYKMQYCWQSYEKLVIKFVLAVQIDILFMASQKNL